MFVVLFGIVGTAHRILDSSTWLAEAELAAKQVESSNEVVVGMQVVDEGRQTMNFVFACIYGCLVMSAVVSITGVKVVNKKKEENDDEI